MATVKARLAAGELVKVNTPVAVLVVKVVAEKVGTIVCTTVAVAVKAEVAVLNVTVASAGVVE